MASRALRLITLIYLTSSVAAVAPDDSYVSYCSTYSADDNSVSESIDLSVYSAGILQSHKFKGSVANITKLQTMPLSCSWEILLPEGSSDEAITLEFLDFDLPENQISDEMFADDANKLAEALCADNYIKISAINGADSQVESRLISGFCGNGQPSPITSKAGVSFLIEVKVVAPYRGFRIKFRLDDAASSLRSSSANELDDGSFCCRDATMGARCIPSVYKCDGISDCENAADECEANCQEHYEDRSAAKSSDSGCGSPRRQEGEQGVVKSMGYPQYDYSNYARCRWFISTTPGKHIRIEFNKSPFAIERQEGINADDCLHDSLTIFVYGFRYQNESEVADRPLTMWDKVCGAFPRPVFIIPHNEILVKFETDATNTFAGFEFTWTAVEPPSPVPVAHQPSPTDEDDAPGRPEYEDGGSVNNRMGQETTTAKTEDDENAAIELTDDSETLITGDKPQVDRRWPGDAIKAASTTTPTTTAAAMDRILTKPDPCRGFGVLMRSVSGAISTPTTKPDNAAQTCTWRLEPKLPAGAIQQKVAFRFYDFTVDPTQDCKQPVIEITWINAGGKTSHGKYSCGAKMPPFEEEQTATSSQPVTVIFYPGVGKNHRFDLGFIIIASRKPNTPAMPNQPVYSPPVGNAFALVRKCGISTAAIPQPVSFRSNYDEEDNEEVPDTRIVGGMPAKPGSWLWAVELSFRGRHMCGGTILDDTWILTAAHCFNQIQVRKKNGWEVIIGRQVTSSNVAWDGQSQPLRPRIKNIMIHKKYGKTSDMKAHDIALIQLEDKIGNPRLAHPACLPSRPLQLSDRCVVVGWGSTKGTGEEGTLREANVPLFDNEKCKSMNSNYAIQVKDTMVCAGYQQGGIDSCQGDSGGPLACYINNRWEIHGVVSFGKGCAGANAPGVYTRVWSYMDWLEQVTRSMKSRRRRASNTSFEEIL